MEKEIRAEIELVRGWYEGHPDSAIIEELAARSVRFQARIKDGVDD